MTKVWTFVSVVVGVFTASALFGWLMFRAAKSADRCNSDPSYRRRQFILLAGIYVVSMVFGVTEVIRGEEAVWSLVFLPIPLLIVYFLLRMASQTNAPPQ